VARILQLLPIRREPNADEWLGEGTVEAIYLNRLIDSVLIKLLATLLLKKKKLNTINDESDGHAAGLIRRESHLPMNQFNGFMRSH
jgi:hypothetical protein